MILAPQLGADIRPSAGDGNGRVTIDSLDRICEALGVQPGDLLRREPDQPRSRTRPRRR